ncbi:MAG TPA: hypothetical protein VHK27_04085 [Gammaproteobacteria bacterium]|nr:hypothetical protein [Gammaproteobacteria bacterium]
MSMLEEVLRDPISIVVEAMNAYEKRCEASRYQKSNEIWGHPGAFVAQFATTREGYAKAAVMALYEHGWLDLDEGDD